MLEWKAKIHCKYLCYSLMTKLNFKLNHETTKHFRNINSSDLLKHRWIALDNFEVTGLV